MMMMTMMMTVVMEQLVDVSRSSYDIRSLGVKESYSCWGVSGVFRVDF